MLVVTLAFAADLTASDVSAHQKQLVEALRAHDLERVEAMYTEEVAKGWMVQPLLSMAPAYWHDQARYLETCKVGAIERVSADVSKAGLACVGATLKVSYHRIEGAWRRGNEDGGYSTSAAFSDVQDGWSIAGAPVGDVLGATPPELPFAMETSPVFVYQPRPMDDALFAMVGTLSGGCGPLDEITERGFRMKMGSGVHGALEDGSKLRYQPRADGSCAVAVSWNPPEGVRLPFPFACQTEACRVRRGESTEPLVPSLVVDTPGKKRQQLRWAPVPGASVTHTVYAGRTLELDVEAAGPLAMLFPKPDRAATAPRTISTSRTTRVQPDGQVVVEESNLSVTAVDDALRSEVEALEQKKNGRRWPGFRVIDGVRAQPSRSFECTAAVPPTLPSESVGPGASWTEVTLEVPVSSRVGVARHHRLIAVSDKALRFDSRVEARVNSPGMLDYHCDASGSYEVDRATLAVVGEFTSTLTFSTHQSDPTVEAAATGKLVERVTITP